MIFVVGSINVDLVVYSRRFPDEGETLVGESFLMNQGGKGANQAISAKKAGGEVIFLGRVGKDVFGEFVKRKIKEFSVSAEIKEMEETSTGVAVINVDEGGRNKIVIIPGANSFVGDVELEILKKRFKENDYLLLQGEIPLNANVSLSEAAKERKGTVIFDPAPAHKDLLRVVPNCSIVTPNEVEIRVLTGENDVIKGAEKLIDYGAESVIVKMGEKGGFYLDKRKKFFFSSFKVEPVDTTGAGDTFNGALASSLSSGMDIREAIKYASAASAISVKRKGAAVSSPYKEEIVNFLEENGEKINY